MRVQVIHCSASRLGRRDETRLRWLAAAQFAPVQDVDGRLQVDVLGPADSNSVRSNIPIMNSLAGYGSGSESGSDSPQRQADTAPAASSSSRSHLPDTSQDDEEDGDPTDAFGLNQIADSRRDDEHPQQRTLKRPRTVDDEEESHDSSPSAPSG